MMTTTRQAAEELKRRLFEVVGIALARFKEDTGVSVSGIDIHMVELTPMGDRVKDHVLGDITIHLSL